MKNEIKKNSAARRGAFTLIELLVVISIIAVLAGFSFPVLQAVKKRQYISKTQAEMGLLVTAIQRYHDKLGFYPPSNPNYPATSSQAMCSPLYFELLGTTINSGSGNYQTLDGSAFISTNSVTMQNGFGVSGLINCTKPGSAEDAPAATAFLSDLKPNQFAQNYTNNSVPVTLLTGSVGGPDPNYPANSPGLNPWRYVSPGVNNPNSYDLWIQLSISGKKYLICNWSSQVQINNPLP